MGWNILAVDRKQWCNGKIDRDINGTRNIFLALKDSSIAKRYELQLVNGNVYQQKWIGDYHETNKFRNK